MPNWVPRGGKSSAGRLAFCTDPGSEYGPTLGQQRPYTLIESDDPALTLGEGRFSDFETLEAAAEALALSPAPCKTVVFDDDSTARELTADEQWRLEAVCLIHDLLVEDWT